MVCVARLKRRPNAISAKANLRISAQLGGSRTRHHDRSRDDLELAAARHHLALMFFPDQRDGASEKSRFGPFIGMTTIIRALKATDCLGVSCILSGVSDVRLAEV